MMSFLVQMLHLLFALLFFKCVNGSFDILHDHFKSFHNWKKIKNA